MRLSKAASAMSVACSALSMGRLVPRAEAQYLKATIRAATEEEIQQMRDNGEIDDLEEEFERNLQDTSPSRFNESFWDIVEFEITNSCGDVEDIKEDLEAAYERYYDDLLKDFGVPGCGEEFEKNTTSVTLEFWEEALKCDEYYRRNLNGGDNVFDEELLRKKRKSRGRNRRKGKCNGCKKKKRRGMEETFVIDLSNKDRKLQGNCGADLARELQQVPGFGRTRVAVNVEEPAVCEVGSVDCDMPSESCCGAPGCFCLTPGVSECESEGCCICGAVPFNPFFCAGVGSCSSDPCGVNSGLNPCAPPTTTTTTTTPAPPIDICPAKDPQTTTVFDYIGDSGDSEVLETYVLNLTTENTTDDEFSCVSGRLTLSSLTPPYNILFNLDLSSSMCIPDCTVLNAQIDATINFVQDLVDTDALDNSNVNFALIRFSDTGEFLGEFNISDPNNSSAINPTLLNKLNSLRGQAGGGTNFKAALNESVDYFEEAIGGRSNIMYFLSDGTPEPPRNFSDEVAALDALDTTRYAIGILNNSDTKELDKIDNTGGAQIITNTDELSDTLLGNPIIGKPVDFQISVNGILEPNINVSDLESTPLGYVFDNIEVDGLDPSQGFINNISAVVEIDIESYYYEVTLMTTNYINGTV